MFTDATIPCILRHYTCKLLLQQTQYLETVLDTLWAEAPVQAHFRAADINSFFQAKCESKGLGISKYDLEY